MVGSGGPRRREVRDQRIDLLGPVSCYSLCAAGDSARSRMKHTYTPVRDAKSGQSGNPARTLNPNVYKTISTARGVQYHTWNQEARALREPGKNPARSHFNLCLAQGPGAFPFSAWNVGQAADAEGEPLEWSAVAKHTLYSLPLQPQPECEDAQRLGDSHEGPGEHLEASGWALGSEADV